MLAPSYEAALQYQFLDEERKAEAERILENQARIRASKARNPRLAKELHPLHTEIQKLQQKMDLEESIRDQLVFRIRSMPANKREVVHRGQNVTSGKFSDMVKEFDERQAKLQSLFSEILRKSVVYDQILRNTLKT